MHAQPQFDASVPTTSDEASNARSSFVENVSSLLRRIEYRRCDRGEDLEQIYRLRYKAYRLHGFLPPSDSEMMYDSLDDMPNCYRFGIFMQDELVCTIRIHHISAKHPIGPAMTTFGDVLMPRLARGESFINPTLLAADPEIIKHHRTLPYISLRLGLVASVHFDATSCIGVIRAEHGAFYRRIFGAVQVGDPRPYPPFTVPVMLYDANVAQNRTAILRRFPFFHSTASERRLLFAQPKRGELPPLTILPTAQFLARAA